MTECNLCKRELKTKKYYEDDKVWIVDGISNKEIMIVWKEHKENLTVTEMEYVFDICMKLCEFNPFALEPGNNKDHWYHFLKVIK